MSTAFFNIFIICSVSTGYDCVIQPLHVSLVHFLYACIKSEQDSSFNASMIQRFVMGFFMILSQVIEYQLDKILYDFSRIV